MKIEKVKIEGKIAKKVQKISKAKAKRNLASSSQKPIDVANLKEVK